MEEKPHTLWIYTTNLFHMICWMHILLGTIAYFLSLYFPFFNPEKLLSLIILILKVTQTLQFSDLFFSLFRFTKGSNIGSFLQISGRNFIVWFVLTPKNTNLVLGLILINWSFADMVRYFYYVNPNSLSLFLRYER